MVYVLTVSTDPRYESQTRGSGYVYGRVLVVIGVVVATLLVLLVAAGSVAHLRATSRIESMGSQYIQSLEEGDRDETFRLTCESGRGSTFDADYRGSSDFSGA